MCKLVRQKCQKFPKDQNGFFSECVIYLFYLFINISVLYVVIFQVLSHNLCTVLSIPHDPVALEEHFRDDDDGPVSSQGYMPYLNKYILDKVIQLNYNIIIYNMLFLFCQIVMCSQGCY